MSWLDTLDQIRTRDFSKATQKERDEAAREVVNLCSYAVAVVAISPLPFSDAILMLPIQSGMVLTVAHLHGRTIERAEATDLLVELGTLAGASFLARQGIKALLPVVGGLLTVPAAFAANWAIGRVAIAYFRDPNLSKGSLKSLYKDALREGKARFSRDEFDRFRKKNEGAVREAAETSAAPAKKRTVKRAAPKPAPAKKATATKPAAKKPATKRKTTVKRRPAAPRSTP
jgi:uncharacterized protein (DUF697 family)